MSAEVAESASPNAGRASGSSFYTAMRILPKPQREAMFAIYGFCRQVDDIADSPGPRDERRAALVEWRGDIEALYQGRPTPLTSDLLQPMRDFGLEKDDFLAVVDGMEMDVLGDIRAPSWTELDLYCDRVASAVGRLSVRIFGLEMEPGRDLAHHLGRALQLTNILRDLDEDAAVGRLYLPREALRQAGVETTDPEAALASPGLDRACREVVAAARRHFDRAHTIMAGASRRAVRAPRIMGEVYRLILERVAERGFASPRPPVRLGKARLAFILMRYALI
jgi:squalene synthase HpnD